MKILITGVTGFIGGHLCRKLLENKKNEITALIRPGTSKHRFLFYKKQGVLCKFGRLTNGEFIKKIFNDSNFDIVYHIAAIRGGRNLPKKDYYETNVNATEYISEQCMKQNCKMIFCSSVGVFGAIPYELPPNNNTKRKNDNYYHFTKIEAEKCIKKLVKNGLKAVMIRPSITYGIGDYGFPYNLISLIDKGFMFLPSSDIKINMIDVNTLTSAFISAGLNDIPSGSAYNIADKEPISLIELTDFISQKLKGRDYSHWKKLPVFILRLFEFIFSKIITNELWKARIELISRSWYYDVKPAVEDLGIKPHKTIPNFNYVVEWYKGK